MTSCISSRRDYGSGTSSRAVWSSLRGAPVAMAPRRTLVVDGSVVEGAASLEEASLVAWRVASAAARHEADEVVVLRAASSSSPPPASAVAGARVPRARTGRGVPRASPPVLRDATVSPPRAHTAPPGPRHGRRAPATPTPPRPRRACAPCPTASKSTIGVATESLSWWFPKKSSQVRNIHPRGRRSRHPRRARSRGQGRGQSHRRAPGRTPTTREKVAAASRSPPRYLRACGYWGFDVRLANAAEDHPAGETHEDEGVRGRLVASTR